MGKTGGSFYITNDQLENFLAEKSKYFLNPQLLRGPSIIPPLNLYSWWRVFKGRIGKASLEDIFKSDSVIFTERKISEYLTARNTPESLRKIRAMVISKFQIRNYFLIYSTLINKIFCESVKDVEQNFLKRQGQAIEFFESFWKICSIDRDGTFLIGEDKLRSIGNFDEVHLTQKNCLTDIKDFFNQTNYHELNTARQFKVMWSLINLWLIYYRSDLFIKTLSFGHQDRNFAFLVSSLLKFITINNSK
ncbi:hypothetical protein BY996DRAFT_7005951 [Phakopsora pachyrhizi]|nr:hypothetical protein BY996DRAFT_7005951 [Phakopsora pachyrhizi]